MTRDLYPMVCLALPHPGQWGDGGLTVKEMEAGGPHNRSVSASESPSIRPRWAGDRADVSGNDLQSSRMPPSSL